MPSVEGNEVIADFELIARGHNGCLPTDAIDDEPVADLLSVHLDCLESELLKHLPDHWVGRVPFQPRLLFGKEVLVQSQLQLVFVFFSAHVFPLARRATAQSLAPSSFQS